MIKIRQRGPMRLIHIHYAKETPKTPRTLTLIYTTSATLRMFGIAILLRNKEVS